MQSNLALVGFITIFPRDGDTNCQFAKRFAVFKEQRQQEKENERRDNARRNCRYIACFPSDFIEAEGFWLLHEIAAGFRVKRVADRFASSRGAILNRGRGIFRRRSKTANIIEDIDLSRGAFLRILILHLCLVFRVQNGFRRVIRGTIFF